jgi:hypothetical protein
MPDAMLRLILRDESVDFVANAGSTAPAARVDSGEVIVCTSTSLSMIMESTIQPDVCFVISICIIKLSY